MIGSRTEVSLSLPLNTFNIKDKTLTLGSCFAETIGSKLEQNKIQTLVNPFGTSYNPHSIHKTLRYAIHRQTPQEHTFLQSQEVYFNYDFHSRFSSLDKLELHKSLSDAIGTTHYFLKDAKWLLLTYGTAWAYSRKDTGDLVSNCHKMPGSLFSKSLSPQNEIIKSFHSLYTEVKAFNPNIQILLTVSPVRHTKDTLELNSVSKSILRLACHTLSETYSDVGYFPAYEIMLDDLRDYRYYKTDLIHPSEEAENYIWEKFIHRYFDEMTKDFLKTWGTIRSALSHKPFQPSSQAHQQFLKDTLKRLKELKNFVNVEEETKTVQSQLIS